MVNSHVILDVSKISDWNPFYVFALKHLLEVCSWGPSSEDINSLDCTRSLVGLYRRGRPVLYACCSIHLLYSQLNTKFWMLHKGMNRLLLPLSPFLLIKKNSNNDKTYLRSSLFFKYVQIREAWQISDILISFSTWKQKWPRVDSRQ